MVFRLLKYGLVILLLCVCACEQQSKTIIPPLAEKGLLDLTHWDFERQGPVNLTGEYEFYWSQLLNPQDFSRYRSSLKPDFVAVPSAWNGFEYQGKAIPGNGYGTYRLTVLLNRSDAALAVKLLEMSTAYNLFLNGRNLASAGMVDKTADLAKPGFHPELIEFQSSKDSLDVVVQVSNFSHRRGGAWETIVLGTKDQLQNKKELKIAYDLFLFGSILIMALYHFGLFWLRRKELSPLFFSAFFVSLSP